MNFFKNRFLATVLLLAVVFGVTPVVAQGQLEDKVSDIEYTMYDWKGIWDRLDERSDAAGNLVSIALDYPALVTEMEALRFAHKEMEDALADDLDDMYEANQELDPAFQALYQKLLEADLSDEDRRAIESYQNTFNGAQRALESAAKDYNDRARTFNQATFHRFPADMLASTFDIEPAEYFGPVDSDSIDRSSRPEVPEVPEAPKVPDPPEVPDAPDLDETINNFVSGITDYVNHTVSDALDDAFDN